MEKGLVIFTESIWSMTEKPHDFPLLAGNISVDVAVIGGGMAGILTAYFLKKQGKRVVVLEASGIGSGQTGKTTAKITSQHGVFYDKLIDNLGIDRARQYAQMNQDAIEDYAKLISEENIDCNFERLPSYLYTGKSPEILEQEHIAAKRLGIDAALTKETELPFPVKLALRFENQAQFHPLKFLNAVAQKVPVFTNTRALEVSSREVFTERGIVRAENIVFATHFPFVNFPGFYFIRMHQERSYVLAINNAQELNGMYYGIDDNGISLRSAEGCLLLGAGAHRTGENRTGNRYRELRVTAKRLWRDCNEVSAYSAQDCMTHDDIPLIGRFSPTRPSWYVATGFKKWGMSSSMVAAKLISSEICTGREQNTIFSPRRFVTAASAPSLVRDIGKSAKGLLKTVLYFPGKEFDELPNGHGGIILYEGRKRGAYKSDDGKTVYIVSVKCPHLGCQLEWNPDEKSWDCPCHGSRFDYRGNLIDNPAQIHLKKAEQVKTP